jgi:hypothetical protein
MANVKGFYTVGNEDYTSIKEVAEVLGRKVTKKEVLAGKVPEVTWTVGDPEAGITSMEELQEALDQVGITDTEEESSEVVYDDPEDMEPSNPADGHMSIYDDAYDNDNYDEVAEEIGSMPEDDRQDDDTPALTNTPKGTKQKLANQEVEYPEPGTYKTEKELKKFYKQLSDAQLDEWLELEGLEYKPCEHEAINRMRKCMAILALHFPKQSKPNKSSKSKYSQYTTEELVQMANDNNIEVRDSKGSEPIKRMYTLMSLKQAGILS